MFDLGAAELLVIVIVAIVVIGPKDMPAALRTAGRWIGKVRKVSTHFRTGLDAMVREAELEDMEKKWQAQNEAIMAQSDVEMTGPPAVDAITGAVARKSGLPQNPDPDASGEALEGPAKGKTDSGKPDQAKTAASAAEPQLPLGNTHTPPSKGEG